MWAWGYDGFGQIGNIASARAQATPLKVNLAGVKSVGAGGTHALALTVDGAAWAWGNNNTGQLGDGGVCGKTCPTPVKVTTLTGATAVTGGYVHSLAAIGDGTARGWGRNAEGELGDGTTTVRTTPVTVTGLSAITATATTTTSAAYTYDGHGTRTSRTIGASTQRFAWDTHAGLPLVLTDGTTSYLYDDTGTPIEQVNPAGVALYYGHDQYRSTRLLTDATGAVTATFTYDPYGNLTNHTGTADTPLRWNGQYQDGDTGLYYLRARYYDPQTGRFLTRDPLEALTLAAYAFGGGNPLNMFDPLGLDWNPSTWDPDTQQERQDRTRDRAWCCRRSHWGCGTPRRGTHRGTGMGCGSSGARRRSRCPRLGSVRERSREGGLRWAWLGSRWSSRRCLSSRWRDSDRGRRDC